MPLTKQLIKEASAAQHNEIKRDRPNMASSCRIQPPPKQSAPGTAGDLFTGSLPSPETSDIQLSSRMRQIRMRITLVKMKRFTTAAALLTAALLTVATAPAAISIMPLKDVRAGMHGTGKTVFSGDKVEDFQVETLA